MNIEQKYNIMTREDKLFVLSLMKRYNIKGVRFTFSGSKKKYPDIWIEDLDSLVPKITVTREWQKQDNEERQKRLVHEIVCHYVLKMNHDESIGFSTYPDRDTYSRKLYRKIKNIRSFTGGCNE